MFHIFSGLWQGITVTPTYSSVEMESVYSTPPADWLDMKDTNEDMIDTNESVDKAENKESSQISESFLMVWQLLIN